MACLRSNHFLSKFKAYQHMPASSEADEDEREGGQDEDDINEETENEINRQIQVFIHKFIKYKVKIHPIMLSQHP